LSEAQIIKRTPSPATVATLTDDLKKLGVSPGMTLLVHSSLSAMGYVCGGPVAVILALEAALGDAGTLVMPAHSGEYSDPAYWKHPPVPESWWQTIRNEMPAFDPDLTPTRCMGAIAEAFRKQQGVLRGRHPQVSFAARGLLSADITADHPFDYALGDCGPLGRLYDLGASILLLGVGYVNNTTIHLAEYRAAFPGKRIERSGAPVMENGLRVWKELEDFSGDSDDFEAIGREFEAAYPGTVKKGKIGSADARLMPARALVDYAVVWMTGHRK
jgi:aminoglycoside 3-N-acetyltransferase